MRGVVWQFRNGCVWIFVVLLCGALPRAGYAETIGDVLGQPEWEWSTGGTAEWTGPVDGGFENGDAVRSGVIPEKGESWLEAAVEGPGTLRFYWRVSSTHRLNLLRFLGDGLRKEDLSGERGWREVTVDIEPGPRALRWNYIKTAETAAGDDAGWLAAVNWDPATNYVHLNPASLRTGFDAQTYEIAVSSDTAWIVETDGMPGWVSVYPESGNGNAVLMVEVDEHPGVVQRRATINIGGSEHNLVQGEAGIRTFEIADYSRSAEGANLMFIAEPGREYRAEVSEDLRGWFESTLRVDGNVVSGIEVDQIQEREVEALPPEGFHEPGEPSLSEFWRLRTEMPPEGFQMVPGGKVRLGDFGGGDDLLLMPASGPVRKVPMSAYYMARSPVTFAEWKRVYDWALENGYGFDGPGSRGAVAAPAFSEGNDRDTVPGWIPLEPSSVNDRHPVVDVNWYDAVKWCNAKSQMQGRTPVYYEDEGHTQVYRAGNFDLENLHVSDDADGYRLPTEAEWETAARGGLEGKRWLWGDDDIDPARANFSNGETPAGTSRPGQYPPNNYGMLDMAGNVWEWVWEPFVDLKSGEGGPVPGKPARMSRGGSWDSRAESCRIAARLALPPGYRDPTVGFRPVWQSPAD